MIEDAKVECANRAKTEANKTGKRHVVFT